MFSHSVADDLVRRHKAGARKAQHSPNVYICLIPNLADPQVRRVSPGLSQPHSRAGAKVQVDRDQVAGECKGRTHNCTTSKAGPPTVALKIELQA